MDFSSPGSSVHGILPAKILEWVAIPFSRESSGPRSPALQADTLAGSKDLLSVQELPVSFLGQEDSPGEGIGYLLQRSWASLVVQLVKNLPAMRETGVQKTWVGKIP